MRWKYFLLVFALFGSSVTWAQTNHCLAQANRKQSSLTERRIKLEAFTQKWIRLTKKSTLSRNERTIPIVFHVVAMPDETTISDSIIYEQLDILNAAFSAANDVSTVPDAFQNLIADVGISFCLAEASPFGLPSKGIERAETFIPDIGSTDAVFSSDLGGSDIWDPTSYVNVYIADLGGAANGRASFPENAGANNDAIVIDPKAFGTTGSPPNERGNTLVHEMGHYFNLLHVWGEDIPDSDTDCSGDDLVEDTPTSARTYAFTCPASTETSCGSADLSANYMYYTDDACQAMFTLGQKERMLATLASARASLLLSSKCPTVSTQAPESIPIKVFPNPSTGPITLHLPSTGEKYQIAIYNLRGNLIWQQETSTETSTFDLNNIVEGVYFLQVKNSTGISIQKLVIQ